MVSRRIWPRSAGLHRTTPVLEFLNRDAEGKGEALIFKTNDFGIHRKMERRKLPAPRFVSRHCCLVPPCCRFSLHVPGAVGGRTGQLQTCGSSQSPVVTRASSLHFSTCEKRVSFLQPSRPPGPREASEQREVHGPPTSQRLRRSLSSAQSSAGFPGGHLSFLFMWSSRMCEELPDSREPGGNGCFPKLGSEPLRVRVRFPAISLRSLGQATKANIVPGSSLPSRFRGPDYLGLPVLPCCQIRKS